jgi:hypothetical protein
MIGIVWTRLISWSVQLQALGLWIFALAKPDLLTNGVYLNRMKDEQTMLIRVIDSTSRESLFHLCMQYALPYRASFTYSYWVRKSSDPFSSWRRTSWCLSLLTFTLTWYGRGRIKFEDVKALISNGFPSISWNSNAHSNFAVTRHMLRSARWMPGHILRPAP